MSYGGTGARLQAPRQVYRCFDGDLCLYVGQSVNVGARMENHRLMTNWADDVTRVECTDHPDHAAALIAERAEIQRLRPRWNVEGRGPRAQWGACDYVEVIDAMRHRKARYERTSSGPCPVESLRRQFAARFPEIAALTLPHLQDLGPAGVMAVSA